MLCVLGFAAMFGCQARRRAMSGAQLRPPGIAFRSRKPVSLLQKGQGIPGRVAEAKPIFVPALAGRDATIRLDCLRPFGPIMQQGAGRPEPTHERGKPVFGPQHEPEHAQEVDEIGFSCAICSDQYCPVAECNLLMHDRAKARQIQRSQPRVSLEAPTAAISSPYALHGPIIPTGVLCNRRAFSPI